MTQYLSIPLVVYEYVCMLSTHPGYTDDDKEDDVSEAGGKNSE